MSGPRAHLRPIGTSIGRLLVLLAALAGLFAMHGLSDHGTGGPDVVVTTDSPMQMTHGSDLMTAHGAAAVAAEAISSQQPIDHSHDMGMAELCLAVLVAALLVGWSLRLRGQRRLSPWRPRWLPSRSILAHLAPARPPDLLALSIQRC